MRRYWASKECFHGDEVHFSGDLFHHIFDVCRQEKGSHFEVLGDGSKAHLIEVVSLEKKRAIGKITETRELPPLPNPKIVLAMSLPRFATMDAVIEKAVELGVHRIQPFYSDFSFLRKKSSLPAGKIDRWEKIVISATQQSGRGDLMEISPPLDLDALKPEINQNPRRRGLFAYEGASTLGLKEYVKSLDSFNFEECWIFIGSEGGFSEAEVDLFSSWGLQPVTLGEQVLRVETACIALTAILKYEFGHMSPST